MKIPNTTSPNIPLENQFVYPTMWHEHEQDIWKTTIGRRNLVEAAEKILAGLCANPTFLNADQGYNEAYIVSSAVRMAKQLCEQLEGEF